MQKQTINELINIIRSNEDTIHRLEQISNVMYDLKWNDSEKIFVDDNRTELQTDEFLSILEGFADKNINNLMKINRSIFEEIINTIE